MTIVVIEDHHCLEDLGREPGVFGVYVALDVDVSEEEARRGEPDLVPGRDQVIHEVLAEV